MSESRYASILLMPTLRIKKKLEKKSKILQIARGKYKKMNTKYQLIAQKLNISG